MNGSNPGEGLMDFNFGGDKPLGKKPKLKSRRPKGAKGAKGGKKGPPKPWQRKKRKPKPDANKDPLNSDLISPKDANAGKDVNKLNEGFGRVGSGNQFADTKGETNNQAMIGSGQLDNIKPEKKDHYIEVEKDATLDKKLISKNEEDRLAGFQEVNKWQDAQVSKQFFMKNLHLYIKEPEEEILIHLLSIMKSIFYSPEAIKLSENLNETTFLKNYCENLMSNAESLTAKDLGFEIIPLIYQSIVKEKFTKQMLIILNRGKTKTQSNMLLFTVEVLKAGHLKKMDYLKNIYDLIREKSYSSEEEIKNSVTILIEEMYLWMGSTLLKYLKLEKGETLKNLKSYVAGVTLEDMKIRNRHGHKVMKIDAYELEDPQDLPKKFMEEKWCDDLMKEKVAEKKKTQLKEFNKILENVHRLKPESNNPKHFLNLAKQFFLEGNSENQVEIIKTIGYFSSSLRDNFEPHSKSIIPILFMKLKDKNSKITDQIIRTLFSCYKFLTIHDTIEEFKEHLFDRSSDKKKNILTLLIKLAEKNIGFLSDPENEDSEVKNIVKMCLKLLEEGDSLVSNKASELIARLREKFYDTVQTILSDISEYSMEIINKFEKKQSNLEGVGNEGDDSYDFHKKKNNAQIKDKLLLIRELREELFSGKTCKVHEIVKFGNFLNIKLKNLCELTEEFLDLDDSELKEIYLLIEELVLKIEPESLIEDSRKLLVVFFFEQSNFHSSTELIRSMQFFIDSQLITPRAFLLDTYHIIQTNRPEINDEFIVNLIRLLETELIIDKNLMKIAHEKFIGFMESYYSERESSARQRVHILGFMRTIEKKFGVNHLENYPELLNHEYELEKIKIKKTLKRFLNRLSEKKKKIIEELLITKNPQRIKHYFGQTEFLNYLKRLLIQEMDESVYSYLVEILEKYLVLYQQNKEEFSLKNYLYVFQIIINNYANKGDAGRIYTHIDKLFHKTVKCLSPNVVFYELLVDPNNLSMREDILNFYLIYHTDITPGGKFMKWLSALIDDRVMYSKDLRKLVEDVLLMLKATEDDELISLGSENKHIKEIWHRNEENILFDRSILYGETLFDSISKFRMIKKFIMDTLNLDETQFYSKTLGRLFKKSSELKKVKAVFYLIKSYENTNRIGENIFNDIQEIEWKREDEITKMIIIKLLFNILKNKIFEGHTEFFISVRKFLTKIVSSTSDNDDLFRDIFDFSEWEEDFFKNLVYSTTPLGFTPHQNDNELETEEDNYNNTSHMEYNPLQVSGNNLSNIYQTNQGNQNLNTTANNVNQENFNVLQSEYQSNNQSYRKQNPNQRSQNSFVLNEAAQNDNKSTYGNIYNEYEYQSNMGNQSHKSKYSRNSNNIRKQQQTPREPRMDAVELLNHNLDLMTTFDYDQFQEGTKYIKQLLSQTTGAKANPEVIQFLVQNANSIIMTYIEVINGVMPAGINFQLGISHYMTIFTPLHSMLIIPDAFMHVDQITINNLISCAINKLVNSNQEKDEYDSKMKENPEYETEQNFKIAEYVTRSLNSVTLKIIQKCEINLMLQGLFQILLLTRESPEWPNRRQIKANSLASKCVLRSFTKIEGNIQKINPQIAIFCILSYTEQYQQSQEDQHAWKAFQTLVNELVKILPPEVIYGTYNNIVGHSKEKIISKWIKAAFSNLKKSESHLNIPGQDVSINQSSYFSTNDRNYKSVVSEERTNPVHERIMEIIQLVNRETRVSKINKFLKQIRMLIDNNRHLNFENYSKCFVKQKYFDKIYNSLYMNDNMSDIQSVISTNTRKTKMESTYNYNQRGVDTRSIRSINKSPRPSRRK